MALITLQTMWEVGKHWNKYLWSNVLSSVCLLHCLLTLRVTTFKPSQNRYRTKAQVYLCSGLLCVSVAIIGNETVLMLRAYRWEWRHGYLRTVTWLADARLLALCTAQTRKKHFDWDSMSKGLTEWSADELPPDKQKTSNGKPIDNYTSLTDSNRQPAVIIAKPFPI